MDPAFFASVRASLYGGALSQHQVDCLNAIDVAWMNFSDSDNRKLAYIFATAHHETGAFKWVKEIWGPTKAQKGYEMRADLGNTLPGDGKKFMGRGFCQITGRRNYADWSKRLRMDLIEEPQLAETVAVAARILVEGSMLGTFTGKKLGDYIKPGSANFVNARHTVNGTDKADLIAGYARKFLAALEVGVSAAPAPKPAPIPISPTSASPKRKTLSDLLKGWFVQQATTKIASTIVKETKMSSNLFHNLLNIVIAIVAILSLPEVVGILPPDIGLAVVGIVGVLKTIINIARDGFGGLFKEQPPVR